MSNERFGFLRVAGCVPHIHLANPDKNAQEIISMVKEAEKKQVGLAVFPRLALTGITCGDLFFQDQFYRRQIAALEEIIYATEGLHVTAVIGFYARFRGQLLDCAAVIRNGSPQKILLLPPAKELLRWFPGNEDTDAHVVLDEELLEIQEGSFSDGIVKIGFGEDEDIRLHLAAHSQLVGTADYQRSLAIGDSGRLGCGYISISPGTGESTTSKVYGGHCILAENGEILAESSLFPRENAMTITEIDCGKIHYRKSHGMSGDFYDYYTQDTHTFHYIDEGSLYRKYAQTPFIPENYDGVCEEIFAIQAHGLARRLEAAHSKKAIIGISGGLDSTLAVLVSHRAHEILGRSPKDIIAITMPGFGTTDHTYDNALALMKQLGVDLREISIKESVRLHFQDIGHEEDNHDVTYENAQARERTQILMDVANMEGGLVVGTGDLSEEALGWCTYNGDHMSMYGVNSDVPKTLVRVLVKWYGDKSEDKVLRDTLHSIADTPISPELLPPDEAGDIAQKTEDKVGPYELHDFFLYHTIRGGMSPEKLLFVAEQTFEGKYDKAVIAKWQETFYRRFFSQQFKRNCSPDGPQVGTLSLSPHGDWVMPSDASPDMWVK